MPTITLPNGLKYILSMSATLVYKDSSKENGYNFVTLFDQINNPPSFQIYWKKNTTTKCCLSNFALSADNLSRWPTFTEAVDGHITFNVQFTKTY